MLHGAGGLSSQMRSMRFGVMGTRARPAACSCVWRGFHALYDTRSGSAPTRDPEGKALTSHAACVGVLETPKVTEFQSNRTVGG